MMDVELADWPRHDYTSADRQRLAAATDAALQAIGLTRRGAIDVVNRSLRHLPLQRLLSVSDAQA